MDALRWGWGVAAGFLALTVGARGQAPVAAQTVPHPEVFRQVTQVVWVVKDVNQVANYWEHLGVHAMHRDGVVHYKNLTYKGKADPATVKQVTGHIGSLEIKWIEPVRGGKFWQEGLRAHGDGIRVVSYEVGSAKELDEEVAYFGQKGAGVVVDDRWHGPKGQGRAVYLDTAGEGGGNTLGLIYNPDAGGAASASAANDDPLGKVDHFAWVVNDVRKVDAYYTRLGFKPFAAIDDARMADRIYRDGPGTYEMWLGWDRTGEVPREWVQQITGPDIYVEYGTKHGEGFHHLGLTVPDMDAAIAQMSTRGAAPSQSAAWNTAKGKGRAVYVDTEPYGGVTLELIYNPR
jgi:catechol 2,3-dioxygenase-like lactoylglutathione lyase family enzyme